MGHRSKESTKETRQKAERLLSILQKTFRQGKEMTKTFKEIRKGYHRMPDGSIMKNSDHPKEENEVDETVSPAQRRARKQAHLKKTMAKYRAASKAGIHPSRVNQRRNTLTLKKR